MSPNIQNILDEATVLYDVWHVLAPTWVPEPGITASSFQDDIGVAAETIAPVQVAETVWRDAVSKADVMAAEVEDTNQAWYRDATLKFGETTQHGIMIRETIPTKSVATHAPKKPVVFDSYAIGAGKVHIDYHIVRGTTAKVFHQGPGDADYSLAAEKIKDNIFEMSSLVAGEHKFKLVGVNSAGDGPESDVIVLQVT